MNISDINELLDMETAPVASPSPQPASLPQPAPTAPVVQPVVPVEQVQQAAPPPPVSPPKTPARRGKKSTASSPEAIAPAAGDITVAPQVAVQSPPVAVPPATSPAIDPVPQPPQAPPTTPAGRVGGPSIRLPGIQPHVGMVATSPELPPSRVPPVDVTPKLVPQGAALPIDPEDVDDDAQYDDDPFSGEEMCGDDGMDDQAVVECQASPPPVHPPALPVQAFPQAAVAPVVPQPVAQVSNACVSVEEYREVEARIEAQVAHTLRDLGIAALLSPQMADPNSLVHQVLVSVCWSASLHDLGPHKLNDFGRILSAHQVRIQAVENEWTRKYQLLSREFDRLMLIERRKHTADTKGEAEIEAVKANPALAQMRVDMMLAKSMHESLLGMGERFAQLEDGIKRTISLSGDDYQRQMGRVPSRH